MTRYKLLGECFLTKRNLYFKLSIFVVKFSNFTSNFTSNSFRILNDLFPEVLFKIEDGWSHKSKFFVPFYMSFNFV